MKYTAKRTYKNMENALKAIALYDTFITRKYVLPSGKVKVLFYEPGFTDLK